MIVKMSVGSILNYRFSSIPIKIPARCFLDIDKLNLKSIWKGKTLRIATTILRKNKVGGLIPPNFKSCYKVTMNKTAWFIKVIEAGMNETK